MSDSAILLVEDDPNDADLTLRALRRSSVGNEIVLARDGVEALDYLFGRGAYEGRDPQETPVLILLDLKLPRMDGLDVLRHIRSHELTRMVPVVVLTSSDEENDLVQSYSNGANSYVRKPVAFTQFAEALGQLSLYWLLVNKAPPTGKG